MGSRVNLEVSTFFFLPRSEPITIESTANFTMEVKLKKKGTRVTWKNQPDCVQETTLRESI